MALIKPGRIPSDKSVMKSSIPFLIAVCLLNTACGTAWVIRRDQGGGVIGYEGFRSGEKAQAAIEKLIDCPFEPVSDQLMSEQYQYTANMPVTTNTNTSGTINSSSGNSYWVNGKSTSTSYVPTNMVGNRSWRELTFKCTDNVSRSTGSSTQSYSGRPTSYAPSSGGGNHQSSKSCNQCLFQFKASGQSAQEVCKPYCN